MTTHIRMDDFWSHTLANEAIMDSYRYLEDLASEEWPTQKQMNLAGKRILHYMQIPDIHRTSDIEAYSIVAFIQDEIGTNKIQIGDSSYITTEELLKEFS